MSGTSVQAWPINKGTGPNLSFSQFLLNDVVMSPQYIAAVAFSPAPGYSPGQLIPANSDYQMTPVEIATPTTYVALSNDVSSFPVPLTSAFCRGLLFSCWFIPSAQANGLGVIFFINFATTFVPQGYLTIGYGNFGLGLQFVVRGYAQGVSGSPTVQTQRYYNAPTLTNGNLYHLLAYVDGPTGTNQAYLNDAPLTLGANSPTGENLGWFSYTPPVNPNPFTSLIQCSTGPSGAIFCDWYFSTLQVPFNLSVVSNRRKFIDPNGNPVFLGSNGQIPTGSIPEGFFSINQNVIGTSPSTSGTGVKAFSTGNPFIPNNGIPWGRGPYSAHFGIPTPMGDPIPKEWLNPDRANWCCLPNAAGTR